MASTNKTHFFRDEHDNRTVVSTYRVGTNTYEACLLGEEITEFGHGATRMEAIADLQHYLTKSELTPEYLR